MQQEMGGMKDELHRFQQQVEEVFFFEFQGDDIDPCVVSHSLGKRPDDQLTFKIKFTLHINIFIV